MPQLENPGSAGYQRYNALQYDPYPLDDVAPPIAGGRPREYDRPIPEVKRGQAFTPKRLRPPPVVASPFAAPASPVFNAPPALPRRRCRSRRSPPPACSGLPYQTPSQARSRSCPPRRAVRPPY